ncbi:MAG: F0F1 ATP synthase subunit gamma [Pseudomonadota bacterium]|uniref:ATP synthase gamma chain n=1 Tax=marine metagenome TaxID=408172 RepID=A0A381R111_9ZZZZ|nr:F0F1 ATP synthase subunit gamma [Gammaproteobacteria bacterium]MEC9285939.1 F0F1 ATP synthase subunit gamma [Pseudomonadota bacterium]MEE3182311.1 F0F1 ATP synthase subunit gamma [Pseudomonadota bacterium]HBP14807.1 F0F1 ATP synthase subunit gamma [Gammaproteobacteria bacterium]HCP50219.1 F0F1 ATP synthase subunit gamma [Gammaproteobacteria bacterium]|tara:strand:- start:60 stop:920 length:861 start_codon:yes stop_codon:yes gene_type:complete
MAVGREIKKKIGSVENTQKVTRAMQMVAASKMRRTQDRMNEARPYAHRIRDVIAHLANANPEYKHVFMQTRPIKRVGYIVVTSDKGQCGGLNANLLRTLVRQMQEQQTNGIEFDLSLVGKKAAAFFRSVGGNVVAAINEVGETPELETLLGGVKVMLDAFEDGQIDRLDILSNEFVNTMTQSPTFNQLLPLEPSDDDSKGRTWDYIYEPDARELVEGLVRRYVESQVYQAVVENGACEQAARMIAMKNATENAETVIEELNLIYNNARQSAITQEIAEIVGGAAAV